jgi:hypothetical protein
MPLSFTKLGSGIKGSGKTRLEAGQTGRSAAYKSYIPLENCVSACKREENYGDFAAIQHATKAYFPRLLRNPLGQKAGRREDAMDKFSIIVTLAGFMAVGAFAMMLPI